jgi:hypothetical protein
MGCCARVLDGADPLTEVRKVAHQELDKWLDQLAPLFDQEKPPTLLELSRHFTQTRTTLLGGVLQSISESLYAHFLDQKQCHCPQCSALLNRKRIDAKHYNTLQGPGSLQRPYFYCRRCKVGFHPLDEALELTRAFHQYDVEEKVLKPATEMPYERAAELVSDLTGVPVSNHHGHDTLVEVAQIAARIPQAQVRIVLLGDGAAWIWNTLTACFPNGTQVLDYYHCSEHLHKVAEAHYGKPPAKDSQVANGSPQIAISGGSTALSSQRTALGSPA